LEATRNGCEATAGLSNPERRNNALPFSGFPVGKPGLIFDFVTVKFILFR
jgi:hypothetical protein